jgi:hypothetical protein
MTATTDESEPRHPFNPAEMLPRLAADAEYFQPRMFAIYGLAREMSGRPSVPFIGWGMDLDGDQGAVFWDPVTNITHLSISAQHVLNTHQRTGEAHLKWLD